MDDNDNPCDQDLRLSVAQDGAADLQLGSVNSNSTLEIVVDGSELLNEGLDLSIAFEKTHDAQGQHSELANHLDGVELRISFDGTQAVGVEVVSSCNGDEDIPGDLQLSLGGSERNSWVASTETHTDTLPLLSTRIIEISPSPRSGNMDDVHVTEDRQPTFPALTGNEVAEGDGIMGECEGGDASHSLEKKRTREEVAGEGRYLKLKTMDDKDLGLEVCLATVAEQAELANSESDKLADSGKSMGTKDQELEVCLTDAGQAEHAEPSAYLVGPVPCHMESSKLKAELEAHESNGKSISNSMQTSITGQSAVVNGADNEVKKSSNGEALKDEQGSNGITKSTSLHSEDDKKEGRVDKGSHIHRGKRRKIAMLLAYCGAGYQGMQRNPGAVTIEGLLEDALVKAGAMPDGYNGNPRKVDWARAARTDKGVSAVGQVVSGLFYLGSSSFVERVNSYLPKQIRLLGYKRVTPTFSAKKFCDQRRYEYVIPIFALDPSTHKNREAVLASEGTEDAFVKCIECSERGWKIPFYKIFHRPFPDKVKKDTQDGQRTALELPSTTTDSGTSPTSRVAKQPHQDAISVEAEPPAVLQADGLALLHNEEGKEDPAEQLCQDAIFEEVEPPAVLQVDGLASLNKEEVKAGPPEQAHQDAISVEVEPATVLQADKLGSLNKDEVNEGPPATEPDVEKEPFHFDNEERARLKRILNHYVGTHNFHNFTSRVKAEDPSAKRFMVSFEVGDVFTVGNTEFVKCTIIGQSFMLHQIRKMIGLAIAVFRGFAPESVMKTALRRDTNIIIPMAPELGLFLDECLYPAYNQKWYNTHEKVSQEGHEGEISRLKQEMIYEHIAATEHKDGQMALFLHSLNDHNFADLAAAREAVATKPVDARVCHEGCSGHLL